MLSSKNISVEIRQSVKYPDILLDSTLNFIGHIQIIEQQVQYLQPLEYCAD